MLFKDAFRTSFTERKQKAAVYKADSPTLWANCVTESKLILPTARQANKSRDKLLGQGIVTLFGKPADRDNGGLVSQRTTFPELEFRLLLY